MWKYTKYTKTQPQFALLALFSVPWRPSYWIKYNMSLKQFLKPFPEHNKNGYGKLKCEEQVSNWEEARRREREMVMGGKEGGRERGEGRKEKNPAIRTHYQTIIKNWWRFHNSKVNSGFGISNLSFRATGPHEEGQIWGLAASIWFSWWDQFETLSCPLSLFLLQPHIWPTHGWHLSGNQTHLAVTQETWEPTTYFSCLA